nr:MAG TPA: hypothetical protein [Caudoviricetes sp.]
MKKLNQGIKIPINRKSTNIQVLKYHFSFIGLVEIVVGAISSR